MSAVSNRLRLIALSSAHVLVLNGCFGTPSAFMKQSESSTAVIPIKKTVEAGITTGIVDPTAFYPQVLGTDEGDLAGSAATFPPGSLAVATQISIQEGVPIATPALAGSLSISNGFQSSAAPIAVTADQNLDAAKPFTIAIPLPATTTSLFSFADPYENLVVAYVVKVAATGETRSGVMPRAALIINGNKVSFESYYFGVYQAALTAEKIREERKAETNVMAVQTKAAQKSLPPMALTGRSPFVAKEGETITLRGVNLRPTIRLAVNGKNISSLNLASDAALSFVVPADTSVGLVTLTAEQDGTTQDVSLIFDGSGAIPVMSGDKSTICSDVQFYDRSGMLQSGTRNCSAAVVADCASDGEVGCKTTASFKAAKMASFTSANIGAGIIVAGVTGTGTTESHLDCAADGATGCVTTTNYKAARIANFTAADIKSGVSIAGVAGSASLESHANCNSDGEMGCVTTSQYKSADVTNLLAGNIKNGVSIAGVAGAYPSASFPLSGATGMTDLTSLAATTPAGSYEFFDALGTRYTGTITDAGMVTPASSNQVFSASLYRQFTVEGDADLAAANIKSGVTLFGVAGTAIPSPATCASDGEVGCVTSASYKAAKIANFTAANISSGITIAGVAGTGVGESHVNCTSDGALGCVTTASYPAADAAMAVVGNIKSGVSIAGVVGGYPSISYPLTGADATPDLDSASFSAKLKSPSLFEFFDSSGTRYTQAGDPDITDSNIMGGIEIFGAVGSIPTCSSDGMTGCITTASYRAADTFGFDSWDLRKGKVVAGVTGQLTFYRNAIGSWNTTAPSPATGAANEVWDTVDDYGTGSFASMIPASPAPLSMGWDIAATGSNWTSASGGQKDAFTGLVWSLGNGTTQMWNNALNYCDTKTDGPAAGTWRLPTQKELMQAYTNGIMLVMSPLSINTANPYWSATTVGQLTGNAWTVKLSTGETASVTKSMANALICVRQGP